MLARKLYQPIVWLISLPLIFLFTAFFGTLVILMAQINPIWATRYIAPLWARSCSLAIPSWFRLHGRERIDPNASYVVVANHLSQTDILALYGWMPLDLKWVIKAELRKVPFLGAACAAMGHLFVDRRNRTVAQQQLATFKGTIEPGTSVLVFPEGTRSKDGKLLPFKRGAFSIAQDLGLPILPVALRHTDHLLPPNSLQALPTIADIDILDPISAEQVAELSLKELTQLARERIESARSSDQNR